MDDKIRRFILNFVERDYQIPENVDFDSFDIFENGYIDSMGFVQFVAILEDEFDVEFTSEELLSDEFKTISGIEKIIRNKLEKKKC